MSFALIIYYFIAEAGGESRARGFCLQGERRSEMERLAMKSQLVLYIRLRKNAIDERTQGGRTGERAKVFDCVATERIFSIFILDIDSQNVNEYNSLCFFSCCHFALVFFRFANAGLLANRDATSNQMKISRHRTPSPSLFAIHPPPLRSTFQHFLATYVAVLLD